MTAAVAGMTGKTGVPLFLAHKNQREERDKNKRKILGKVLAAWPENLNSIPQKLGLKLDVAV